MFDCILLAAGLSSRFKSPKALALLNSETVIEHLQQMLLSISQINKIHIVTGAHFQEIKPFLLKHRKINVVYNKDYKFGQTSSFKAGLLSVDNQVRAVFLLPVDYPFIIPDTIKNIINVHKKQQPMIIVPQFKGANGHPPLFSLSLRQEFLRLGNDEGINTLVHAHKEDCVFFSVDDPGVLKTFNTKEEFAKLKTAEGLR